MYFEGISHSQIPHKEAYGRLQQSLGATFEEGTRRYISKRERDRVFRPLKALRIFPLYSSILMASSVATTVYARISAMSICFAHYHGRPVREDDAIWKSFDHRGYICGVAAAGSTTDTV